VLLTLAVLGCTACQQERTITVRDDFKAYYDQYDVEGSFALYDPQADRYILYDRAQFEQPFSPASTFKICNALIALETGVIADEHAVIPWDSVARNLVWDRDHDLRTAFKNSTVWYYQELARRVGGERMNYWLKRAAYGNADTSGGIDRFWLSGGLRISPAQQLDFLQRLHDNELPFSQRSMDIVKNIMIASDTLGHVVRGKTGWGSQGTTDIGWYVGYLEVKGNVYYFANCVQIEAVVLNDAQRANRFNRSRTEIVQQIVDELKLTHE
jgi:beta-lactamase class D